MEIKCSLQFNCVRMISEIKFLGGYKVHEGDLLGKCSILNLTLFRDASLLKMSRISNNTSAPIYATVNGCESNLTPDLENSAFFSILNWWFNLALSRALKVNFM